MIMDFHHARAAWRGHFFAHTAGKKSRKKRARIFNNAAQMRIFASKIRISPAGDDAEPRASG
jgi:hypothetical protein